MVRFDSDLGRIAGRPKTTAVEGVFLSRNIIEGLLAGLAQTGF